MQIKHINDPILLWYNKKKRSLPFRFTTNPYKIWLSEVMLQQTRVNTVIPYYNNWIKNYPSLLSVANAKLSSLLKMWEGLGYYSRCKNFHQACKIVINDFQGIVPSNLKDFKSLPGVGDYTASAVLSIAYNKPYPVIDTNVKRVLCRLLGIKNYNKYNRNRIQKILTQIISKKYPGNFNQGLMEIGALICSTTNPICKICPIQSFCIAFQRGKPDSYPIKNKRKKLPHYEIVAGIIWRRDKFYVQRRDKEAMLGGLWEFPGGKVEPGESLADGLKRELKEECGFSTKINKKIACINHTYSHFSISLHLFQCEENKDKIKKKFDTKWIRPGEIHSLPFPKANHKLFKILKKLGWYV
tara:strand:- start:791 stop:1855 length:1065 start_codon:yes stop_codon:yes gene_type:complete